MATLPSEPIPTWATASNAAKAAPLDAKREIGWEGVTIGGIKYGEQPSYLIFNYMMYSYGEWLTYLNNLSKDIQAAGKQISRTCNALVSTNDYTFTNPGITEASILNPSGLDPATGAGPKGVALRYKLLYGFSDYNSLVTNRVDIDKFTGAIEVYEKGTLIVQALRDSNTKNSVDAGKPDFYIVVTCKAQATTPTRGYPRLRVTSGLMLAKYYNERTGSYANFDSVLSGQGSYSFNYYDLKTDCFYIVQQNVMKNPHDINIEKIAIPIYLARSNSLVIPVSEGDLYQVWFNIHVNLMGDDLKTTTPVVLDVSLGGIGYPNGRSHGFILSHIRE